MFSQAEKLMIKETKGLMLSTSNEFDRSKFKEKLEVIKNNTNIKDYFEPKSLIVEHEDRDAIRNKLTWIFVWWSACREYEEANG